MGLLRPGPPPEGNGASGGRGRGLRRPGAGASGPEPGPGPPGRNRGRGLLPAGIRAGASCRARGLLPGQNAVRGLLPGQNADSGPMGWTAPTAMRGGAELRGGSGVGGEFGAGAAAADLDQVAAMLGRVGSAAPPTVKPASAIISRSWSACGGPRW